MVKDTSHVFTVDEAGRMLGISRALAYDLVRKQVIPSLRLGRRIVVPRAALLALLDTPAGSDQPPAA